MKTSAISRLREKIRAAQPVYGLWVTLESPSITEMAVAIGLDWVVIDAEHGHLDWKAILEHVRAAVRSDTVVLVRIAELNSGLIKRSLDIGADGVVVPWIETADQLRQAIVYATYPPEGRRGIGAERATGWGECFLAHTQEANDQVLVVPVIETVLAGKNINSMCEVQGADIFFLGPADYSSSAGYRGQWEGPGVAQQLISIKDVIRARGKACGLITTSPENLVERRQQGFQMLAVGSDTALLLRGLHGALGAVGQDRRILPSLIPELTPRAMTPLSRPPEAVRPDRLEAVGLPGQTIVSEMAPGVGFEPLVGSHNGARNLTTGLVTFEPGTSLPYHTHPVTESITVLTGSATVSVEGREYLLGPLDNVTIPRGLPHSSRNTSTSGRTVLHAALASETPTRELVPSPSKRESMSKDSQGLPEKERVTRFATALRSEAGPGTSFIDYFNHTLMPGLEMSGGYGLFQPGGRLPAHYHDFDESICITQGVATCVVEGRRYSMADCATSLQPRGRVHYFVNDSPQPMAMIWVYAGPLPERNLVDELCATAAGNPWREGEVRK